MRTLVVPLLSLVVAGVLTVPQVTAQYNSPSSYTRKIVPPSAPTPPTAPKAPATPQYRPTTNFLAAPAAPTDPSQAQAAKDEQTKKVVASQKQRAEAGQPTAQYDLGVRFMKGDGVERSFDLSRKWLTAASTNGHPNAVRKLSELDELVQKEKDKATP